jgi:hypothetical protein
VEPKKEEERSLCFNYLQGIFISFFKFRSHELALRIVQCYGYFAWEGGREGGEIMF